MKAENVSLMSGIGGGGSLVANDAAVVWQAPEWMLYATAWMELIAPPIFMLGVILPIAFKIHDWWQKRK